MSASQKQPKRPLSESATEEPVKYGDVFPGVDAQLAREPIRPRDAAMMQAEENRVIGETQRSGPAAVMQSAATANVRKHVVSSGEVTDEVADKGVAVEKKDVAGSRVYTEKVAGEVVGEYHLPENPAVGSPGNVLDSSARTIGDALQMAAENAGDKAVEMKDAAAVQAAEMRAVGTNKTLSHGVASAAQSAADYNSRVMAEEQKIKLGNVLRDAKQELPEDKTATREDARGVTAAEARNDPSMSTDQGGVAAAVTAVVQQNEKMGG